jgi:hypothetical protein
VNAVIRAATSAAGVERVTERASRYAGSAALASRNPLSAWTAVTAAGGLSTPKNGDMSSGYSWLSAG